MVSNCPKVYAELLDAHPWSLLLATHIHLHAEVPLLNAAYVRGIPTLGIVNSWDNVYKGIRAHPDYALVWSEINKKEMINFEGYEDAKTHPRIDIGGSCRSQSSGEWFTRSAAGAIL